MSITIRSEGIPFTARQRRESDVLSRFNFQPHQKQPKSYPTSLIVSPYTEPEHQLDLSTVDTPNRLLAQALTRLEASTPEYATTAYPDAFNWPLVFKTLRRLAAAESFHFPQTEFYVVDFRSKLKDGIDNDLLFKLDKESHREATASGGLLKYWYGAKNSERRNLATCLWRGKEDAIEGGKGIWHKQARTSTGSLYESIDVTGVRLVVGEGAKEWKFDPWFFH